MAGTRPRAVGNLGCIRLQAVYGRCPGSLERKRTAPRLAARPPSRTGSSASGRRQSLCLQPNPPKIRAGCSTDTATSVGCSIGPIFRAQACGGKSAAFAQTSADALQSPSRAHTNNDARRTPRGAPRTATISRRSAVFRGSEHGRARPRGVFPALTAAPPRPRRGAVPRARPDGPESKRTSSEQARPELGRQRASRMPRPGRARAPRWRLDAAATARRCDGVARAARAEPKPTRPRKNSPSTQVPSTTLAARGIT